VASQKVAKKRTAAGNPTTIPKAPIGPPNLNREWLLQDALNKHDTKRPSFAVIIKDLD
jgi:hypothetical protein